MGFNDTNRLQQSKWYAFKCSENNWKVILIIDKTLHGNIIGCIRSDNKNRKSKNCYGWSTIFVKKGPEWIGPLFSEKEPPILIEHTELRRKLEATELHEKYKNRTLINKIYEMFGRFMRVSAPQTFNSTAKKYL